MKVMLAAVVLSLSFFATNALADDAKAPVVIMIEASDAAEAQIQCDAARTAFGDDVICTVKSGNPQADSAQRDIGSIGVSI